MASAQVEISHMLSSRAPFSLPTSSRAKPPSPLSSRARPPLRAKRPKVPTLSEGICFFFFALYFFAGNPAHSQTVPLRPQITGIAYVRMFSADLNTSREFYGKILGLTSGTGGCLGIARPTFPVNSHPQLHLTHNLSPTPNHHLLTTPAP